ncbi:MAG: ABC transporter ATP-binding protein, partial [Turicibacter sp.]
MNHKILEVKNISKRYKKRMAVNGVSFDGYAGEVLGFLGPNGAGKTTTIRMITSLIKSDSGSVEICGHDTKTQYEQAMKQVGAIVETPYLYEYMSGYDNLELFAQLKQVDKERVNEIIQLIGLTNRLSEKVKGYSLGMKQRLGIGVALLAHPKLLILDEPTNGLDPAGIKTMREFLQRIAHEEQVCVLVSSHMLLEMQKMCDRFVI